MKKIEQSIGEDSDNSNANPNPANFKNEIEYFAVEDEDSIKNDNISYQENNVNLVMSKLKI